MTQKVLVTGGAGYIGSHTVVELQNEGFEVFIVDNLSNSKAEVIDNIEKVSGIRPHFQQFDLNDKNKVFDFFRSNPGIKSIIHFAASKAVGESVEKPLLYYGNNINSLINIMEAMKEFKVDNLVFSSSCTVYGQPEKLPVTEHSPILPAESPYGNTKQICEEIIRDTAKTAPELNSIALRYFNPVGAHSSSLIGELPIGVPANLMPFITQTGAGIREELTVFGDDYDTKDGTCIRDFIHVVDLAKAHIAALKRMIDSKNKANYEVFNVGTGNGFTVLEIIKSFEKTSGVKLKYKLGQRREGDIEKIWANTEIVNNELGWKAEKTLDDMTLSAWKWQQTL